jgi:hypothetical protein
LVWPIHNTAQSSTGTKFGGDIINKLSKLFSAQDSGDVVQIKNNKWTWQDYFDMVPPLSAPATPTDTNAQRHYIDPADQHYKFKKTDGSIIDITAGGIYRRAASSYKYLIYQDASDANKFKAVNGVTGIIDYVSTDSTNADTVLQNVLNGGGSIFLFDATYPVSSASGPCLTIPDNTNIVAQSPNTIIQGQTSRAVLANVTRSGGGNSNIVIQNLTIDGQWDGSSASVTDACGILLDFVTDVQIRNCKVKNTWAEGIKCRNSTRALIQGNYVNGTPAGAAGMIIASNSNYGQILGNLAVDCGGESYSAVSDTTGTSTNHVIISNNIGYVTSTSQNTRGHILIEALSPGIAVNDVVVSNNNITAGFSNGIIVSNAGGRNIVISGNTITHFPGFTTFPATPSAGNGISISCHSVTVTGNIIHDVLGHGIVTSSGNSKISITNNIIRNVALNAPYSANAGYQGPYDGIINTSTAASLFDNVISNNIIIDENTNMRYGINMAGTGAHTNMLIIANSIRGNQTSPSINLGAYGTTTNCFTINNAGYTTHNQGTKTSNGAVNPINIAHGLAKAPTYVNVLPQSSDALGSIVVTADATNIIVTYQVPPPTGTNNVILWWEARVLI